MFPILKTEYFYLWFFYKSDLHISCFRNDGEMKVSKVHRTCHSINGGSLEIAHVFHLSISTSNRKKYFKISLLPLTKKSFNQYSLQCKYIFDITIYYTICINPMKIFFFKSFHLYFSSIEAYTTVLRGIA